MSQRLIIVSNRLPVTVRVEHGDPAVHMSVGGLATGLRARRTVSPRPQCITPTPPC